MNNTNEASTTQVIPSSISSSSADTTVKKPFVIERKLDEASGGRILAHHYRRGDGSSVTEKRSGGLNTKTPVNTKTQFAESFYVPQPEASTKRATTKEASVWDLVADKLSWTTSNNVQLIDLLWLVENNYTIRELLLLEGGGVKITDLIEGGIVTTFHDLLKLKFQVADLKCAPLLFGCKDLRTLFGVTARCVCGLRARPRPGQSCRCITLADFGMGINVVEEPHFFAQDLVTLGYSLGETVEAGEITADMLQSLNYAPSDLRELGLGRKHLHKLKISRDRGIRARTDRGGFAWGEAEWNLFV